MSQKKFLPSRILLAAFLVSTLSLGVTSSLRAQDFGEEDGQSLATVEAATEAGVWRQISTGLPALSSSDIRSLAADPTDPNTLYAGFATAFGMAHGVYKTTDGGVSWAVANTGLRTYATVTGLYVDPANPQILYAVDDFDLYKSGDGAGSWAKLEAVPKDVYCVAVYGPNLYIGGYLSIYKSGDGGLTVDKTVSSPGGVYNALWFDPVNPDHVLATDARVFESWDGGENWTEFSTLNSSLCAISYIPELAVAPDDQNVIFAGTWSCIVKSIDGGKTWNKVRDLGHVNGLLIHPNNTNLVYASGDEGVYRSPDGGQTWDSFGAGLPFTTVVTLALGPPGTRVAQSTAYAGVTGYGVYTTRAEGPSTPAAPTGLKILKRTATSIRLGWTDKADNETGFTVQRKRGGCASTKPWTKIKNLAADTRAFTNNSLLPKTAYAYRVRAFNATGASAFTGCVSARTLSNAIVK